MSAKRENPSAIGVPER